MDTYLKPTTPSLLLSPDGSFDKNGPVTPTLFGGVREVEGRYENKWIEIEETTNFITDPAITALNQWGTWNGSKLSIDSTIDLPEDAPEHVNVLKATFNTIHSATSITSNPQDVPIAEGEVWTLSAYVRHNWAAPHDVRFQIYCVGPNTAAVTIASVEPNEWKKLTVTVTIPDGTTKIYAAMYTSGGFEGSTLWMCLPQLEKKPYATPYVDGNMNGANWTGVPNQSTSTREYRKLPDGKHSHAWQTAEATTNLHNNPSVEVNTSHWGPAIVAGGGTVARVPASLHGDYAYQITRNEVRGYTYVYSSVWGERPQTPHTFSLTVQCTKARRVQLECVFWGGSSLLGNPFGPVTTLVPDTPERLVFTATPPAGTDRVELRFRLIQPDNQEGVYLLDGAQYEEKPYATPYCDGSLGEGFAWTGTPHGSASTRAQAYVHSAAWKPKASGGTLIVRHRRHSKAGSNPYIFSSGATNDLFLSATTYDAWRAPVVYIKGQPYSSRLSTAPPVAVGESSALALSWVNGRVAIQTLEGGRREADFSDASWIDSEHGIMLGRYGQFNGNVDIDGVLAFNEALTEDEIQYLMEMPEPWSIFNSHVYRTAEAYQSNEHHDFRIRIRPKESGVTVLWGAEREENSDFAYMEVKAGDTFKQVYPIYHGNTSLYNVGEFGEIDYIDSSMHLGQVDIDNVTLQDEIRLRAISEEGVATRWMGNTYKSPIIVVTPEVTRTGYEPHTAEVVRSEQISESIVDGKRAWKVGVD